MSNTPHKELSVCFLKFRTVSYPINVMLASSDVSSFSFSQQMRNYLVRINKVRPSPKIWGAFKISLFPTQSSPRSLNPRESEIFVPSQVIHVTTATIYCMEAYRKWGSPQTPQFQTIISVKGKFLNVFNQNDPEETLNSLFSYVGCVFYRFLSRVSIMFIVESHEIARF